LFFCKALCMYKHPHITLSSSFWHTLFIFCVCVCETG
jgi:hypothetical protein